MTNWDKYKEDIENIIKTGYNFKITNENTIEKCRICDDCKFVNDKFINDDSRTCCKLREKWLNSTVLDFDSVYEEFTKFCKSHSICEECEYYDSYNYCDSRFIFNYLIEHKDLLGE